MVVPAIARATQVAVRSVNTAQRTKLPTRVRTRATTPDQLGTPNKPFARRTTNTSARTDRYTKKLLRRSVGTQSTEQSSVVEHAESLAEKARIIQVSWLIVLTLTPFWLFQVYAWLIGVGALGVETIFIIGNLLPGDATAFIFFIVAGIVGLILMMVTTVMYLIRGVHCFGGNKPLVFMVLLAVQGFPLTSFLPCFGIWILAVVLMRD